MLDGYILAKKAQALRAAGMKAMGDYLAKLARRLGVSTPPAEIELPALPGLSSADLDELHIRHRQTSDGLVIIRRIR